MSEALIYLFFRYWCFLNYYVEGIFDCTLGHPASLARNEFEWHRAWNDILKNIFQCLEKRVNMIEKKVAGSSTINSLNGNGLGIRIQISKK